MKILAALVVLFAVDFVLVPGADAPTQTAFFDRAKVDEALAWEQSVGKPLCTRPWICISGSWRIANPDRVAARCMKKKPT